MQEIADKHFTKSTEVFGLQHEDTCSNKIYLESQKWLSRRWLILKNVFLIGIFNEIYNTEPLKVINI